jgi:endonuclease III
MNFRFSAVPQELAGGNMSPMRKTAGQKAAATRKRNAAKRQAAAKKAASTRKWGSAGKKAAATRKLRAAGQKAAKTRTRRAAARKAAATRASKKEQAAFTQPAQVQEPPAPEPQVQTAPETSIPE